MYSDSLTGASIKCRLPVAIKVALFPGVPFDSLGTRYIKLLFRVNGSYKRTSCIAVIHILQGDLTDTSAKAKTLV